MARVSVGWDPGSVFERFTDRARRVLVLAQEEASLLNHNFIGTEHILLGLIREGEGVAAVALERLGVSFEDARTQVDEIIGNSSTPVTGSPPFTPRAKKVLELSLREALQFGHNYIGTEHLLLGLVREGEGVAAQVLVGLGLDLGLVRGEVLQVLSGNGGTESVVQGRARGELVACSFCGRRPPESGRLVAGRQGAYVCEHCVSELTDRLAAGPDDPEATPPTVVVTGRRPGDEEAARSEIVRAFGQALVLSPDRRTVPSVEGGELLGPCLKEAQERHASLRRSDGAVIIDRIEFVDETHASVLFAVAREGISPDVRSGEALMVDSTWKMARATFCALMTLAGVTCPPTT
jgi:hypothetical protein